MKQQYHNLVGKTSELVVRVKRDPTLAWLMQFADELDASLTNIKTDLSKFAEDMLLLEAGELKKKYGEEDTSTFSKQFIEQVEPKLASMEEKRMRLERHLRVG